jgi:hypothetical protein
MATGRHAFAGDTEAVLHDAILTQTQRSAHDLNPAVPRGLEAVITRALKKDRSQRYQVAADIRTDLEGVRRAMQPMRRRVRRGLAYSVLLLIVATGAWIYWSYRTRVTLSSSDTIVLADISNHTVDPVLNDALNIALHTGLEQTPYLQILGPDKVFGTLVQLGLHYDVRVTPEIARQVCLKTNSKVVITSSIADAGNRFQIELGAVGCQSGVTMARVREDVGGRENIVHELGAAAVSLRRKLGEPAASLQQFNQPLEVATSSSLEALQLLMEGYKHHIARDVRGASTLYQRAIDLDPNFALAYSALGAADINVLGEESRMKTAEERAFTLQDRMTVPDRFQAETGYYDLVTGELEKSSLIYARWLQLFPQNIFVRVNYAHCLRLLGRADQAVRLARDAGRLLPDSMYVDLMGDYIVLDRLSEAKATFDEARAHRIDGVYLRDRRMLLAFLQKDNAAMQEQWSWAVGKPGADAVVYGKAMVETYYGKFRDGRSLIEQAIALPEKSQELNPSYYRAAEAAREAEVGNLAEARRGATNALSGAQDRYANFKLALAFALAGDLPRAQKLADALNQKFPLDTLAQNYSLPTIRAAMKLKSNDPAGAVEILQPALRYELANAIAFNSVYPAYIRGCAYLQMGDGRSAAAEFQKLLDHPGLVGREVIGALSRLQLARAQKMSGDETAALKSYEEFLTLWENADSNIPIYQQAKAEYAKLLSQSKTREAKSAKSPA